MAPILIYLLTPLLGIALYFVLVTRFKPKEDPASFAINLFVIFSIQGGLLLVLLTTIFWMWSGMASLGMAFLLFIAPIIMGFIAYQANKSSRTDTANKLVFIGSALYFFTLPFVLLISLLVG